MNRRKSKLPSYSIVSEDPLFKNYEFNPLVNSQLIIESFKIFDENRTDDLDKKEFKKLMTALGSEKTDREINDLYIKIDTDKSGTIDLNEFNSMMLNEHFNKNTPVQYILEKCFDLYDKDNDGYIDCNDLQKVGDEFEEFTQAEELAILISLIKEFSIEANIQNKDQPNKISKDEFINCMIKMQFIKEIEREKEVNKDNQNNQIGDEQNMA